MYKQIPLKLIKGHNQTYKPRVSLHFRVGMCSERRLVVSLSITLKNNLCFSRVSLKLPQTCPGIRKMSYQRILSVGHRNLGQLKLQMPVSPSSKDLQLPSQDLFKLGKFSSIQLIYQVAWSGQLRPTPVFLVQYWDQQLFKREYSLRHRWEGDQAFCRTESDQIFFRSRMKIEQSAGLGSGRREAVSLPYLPLEVKKISRLDSERLSEV